MEVDIEQVRPEMCFPDMGNLAECGGVPGMCCMYKQPHGMAGHLSEYDGNSL